MKNLKKTLFVQRPELEGRWWHRLAKVLIYCSTISVLIIGIFGAYENSKLSSIDLSYKAFQTSQQDLKTHPFLSINGGISAVNQYTDWAVFAQNLPILLVVTLGWFIFWESIVYRMIVYIIYGSKSELS